MRLLPDVVNSKPEVEFLSRWWNDKRARHSGEFIATGIVNGQCSCGSERIGQA